MATNIPLISGEREDNYELELSRVRGKIKSTFAELIVSLEARESELSPIESVHEEFIARVTTELKSIETPTEPKIIYFCV